MIFCKKNLQTLVALLLGIRVGGFKLIELKLKLRQVWFICNRRRPCACFYFSSILRCGSLPSSYSLHPSCVLSIKYYVDSYKYYTTWKYAKPRSNVRTPSVVGSLCTRCTIGETKRNRRVSLAVQKLVPTIIAQVRARRGCGTPT